MERIPKTGEFYRHFKNKLYQIVAVARHTETGEELVIYQALYGDFRIYARPLSMFVSEVDHEKYPDVQQKYRFEKVVLKEQGDGSILEEAEQKETASEEELCVNPWLERFLDADGYDKQLEALNQMRGRVGQKELDSIYLVLDITPAGGEINSQLQRIMRHLETRKKYDGSRLR